MKRHFNSFTFSFFVHVLLILLIYLSYKEITLSEKGENKEPLLCIKLASVCEKRAKDIPRVHKKTPTKKKVKPLKKIIHKQKKVKTVPIKKEKVVVEEIIEVTTVVVAEELQRVEPIKEVHAKEKTVQINVKDVKKKVSPEKIYIDEHLEKIIKILRENLYYPRHARKRGIQGEILVRFTLSKEAKISDIEVLSSKSEILSRGAIQTIKNIDNKLPKPKEEITFNIPISYRLN